MSPDQPEIQQLLTKIPLDQRQTKDIPGEMFLQVFPIYLRLFYGDLLQPGGVSLVFTWLPLKNAESYWRTPVTR